MSPLIQNFKGYTVTTIILQYCNTISCYNRYSNCVADWKVPGSNPDTCKYFLLLQNIQTGSGDHLSSYSVGAGGSSRAEVKNEWSYTSAPPIRLHLSTKKGHHRPKQRKGDTRFGTWNVRSLYRAGSLTAAARELARCK